MSYQHYLQIFLAISVLANLILIEMHSRRRADNERLHTLLTSVRTELAICRQSAESRQDECDKVNRVCTQYRAALMNEEQQDSGRYNRTYEVVEGPDLQDSRVQIPKFFTSGRVAAFFLTDWSEAKAPVQYWENIGRLYSIPRGTTSKIVDRYTIKVA